MEKSITSIIAVTVIVFAFVFGLGLIVQKVSAKMMRAVNWVAFAVAIASGLASYNLEQKMYLYIFFASLVVYFLTIRYRTK